MIPVSWCGVPPSASWLCCGNAGRQAADLHGCRCLDTRRMRVQVHVPAGHPQDPADYAPPELRNPGDEDLLFAATVMHDLGLGEHASGEARFEVEGADLAAAVLRQHGVAEPDIDQV